MGKSPVATRRRGRHRASVRRAPVFPAQRRAAREQAARMADKVSQKVMQKATQQVTGNPPARRLPRPVVWLLWFLGAAAASVFIGFALGLARPRTRPEGQV